MMMKRRCKVRAEWRVQLGKATERISAHYRLDCDHGTAIMVCFEEGGAEPINLCEKHAEEIERSGKNRAGARAMAAVSAPAQTLSSESGGDDAKKLGDSTRSAEVKTTRDAVHAKPKASIPSETTGPVIETHARRPAAAATTSLTAAREQSSGSAARDVTYGNPVKALVDETIWNMGTGDYGAYRLALREGKSVAEAAQAAGGQLAVVHRKVSDYTRKLEVTLSESKAIISVREAIDRPLEQAILEIIGKDDISETEKDIAIQQLGSFEAWVKRGLSGELTPLDASRIVREIGERLNWGGSDRGDKPSVPQDLKPAYAALFGSLKGAIYSAAPGAQNLLERLINLQAVKSDLENMPMMKELNTVTA